MNKNIYPFSAIVGQQDVKKVLLLSVINPKIGGVLLIGGKGLAKTTAVRALGAFLHNKKVVELPLNVSEDRLIGSFQLEKAIVEGKVEYEKGILAAAHEQLLYVDEVNLLDDQIVNLLLETVASGELLIERDMLSHKVPASITLIGTMNPEEGELRASLLDRFGLTVSLTPEVDLQARVEIMDRRNEFEQNPTVFQQKWHNEQVALLAQIQQAIALLPQVKISNYLLEYCSRLCLNYSITSLRADLILVQTAKTIAALEQEQAVTKAHVLEAAQFVLAHRGSPLETQPQEEQEEQQQQEEQNDGESQEETNEPQSAPNEAPSHEVNPPHHEPNPDSSASSEPPASNEYDDDVTPDWLTERLLQQIAHAMGKVQLQLAQSKKASKLSGQRAKKKSLTKKGRYRQAISKKMGPADIALDATIRTAAPYQISRQKAGFSLVVEKEDFRYKKREVRAGATILFVLDISGSMGAKERIAAVRGTLFNILQDAYEKRDRVAVIAFRREKAELVVPPTNSVDMVFRQLQELPTGGKTPIAHALQLTEEVALQQLKHQPERDLQVVFITDGKANVALKNKPIDDMLHYAYQLSTLPLKALVLDTEIQNFIQLGYAKKLADALQANYLKLEKIDNESILKSIHSQI